MAKISAGLLMYKRTAEGLRLLLVHPGGPFWCNKDEGAWTVPKGLIEEGEPMLQAARREFEEETGMKPTGPFVELRPVRQKGGKLVHCWAFEGDCDPAAIRSNTFTMQWPPRSGRYERFPEIDRAEFFTPDDARRKINPAQAEWIDDLERLGTA